MNLLLHVLVPFRTTNENILSTSICGGHHSTIAASTRNSYNSFQIYPKEVYKSKKLNLDGIAKSKSCVAKNNTLSRFCSSRYILCKHEIETGRTSAVAS